VCKEKKDAWVVAQFYVNHLEEFEKNGSISPFFLILFSKGKFKREIQKTKRKIPKWLHTLERKGAWLFFFSYSGIVKRRNNNNNKVFWEEKNPIRVIIHSFSPLFLTITSQ
jgi:hypothetical protein